MKSMERGTLFEALYSKYGEDEQYGVSSTEKGFSWEIMVPGSMPGISADGKLVIPRELALDDCGISSVGVPGDLQQSCQSVSSLDLTKNHLTEWREIEKILLTFTGISFLNLTSNDLRRDAVLENSFPNLTTLVLNKTFSPWTSITVILHAMPQLVELHLSLNKYSSVQLNGEHPQLKRLFFNGNNITRWQDIAVLSQTLPKLESLVIMDNVVTEIDLDDSFSQLTSMNISNWPLKNWDELDKLDEFPSLTELRMKGIFTHDMPVEQVRQHAIARLPKIQHLNGCPVRDMEREDAERSFLRHFKDASHKPARYNDLLATYGQLDPLAKISLKPKYTVTAAVIFDNAVEYMHINLKQTVRQFKKLLVNVTKLPVTKFRVFYDDCESPFGSDEMRFPDKYLYTYNVKECDQFHILRR